MPLKTVKTFARTMLAVERLVAGGSTGPRASQPAPRLGLAEAGGRRRFRDAGQAVEATAGRLERGEPPHGRALVELRHEAPFPRRSQDRLRRPDERPEAAAEDAQHAVERPEAEPVPPRVAREAEHEVAAGALRRGAHERVRVGVAADDAVEDDDVGGGDEVRRGGDVAEQALGPAQEVTLLQQAAAPWPRSRWTARR